jgi:hypothetical protein
MPDDQPDLPHPLPATRRSRVGLFAPFILLGLVVAGWSTAWFLIRDRTRHGIDDWIAGEAAAGRQWTCPNRTVGGFPFRIEVACDSLTLQRPDLSLSLGPVSAVAQVYQPRHLIAYLDGPLRISAGAVEAEGTWRGLQASLHLTSAGLQRASVVAEAPAFRLTGVQAGNFELSTEHLESYLRPNPNRVAERAYDWSLQAAKLALPGLDALVGGTEPADLGLDLIATQVVGVPARSAAEELERWRQAGGRLEVPRLTLAKGPRRLEGKGQFGLDEAHRPQGRADLAAAGLGGLLGPFTGNRGGATAALLGALTGRRADPAPTPPAAEQGTGSGLKPLPPLRIEGGRVQIGALPIPGLRVAPLY